MSNEIETELPEDCMLVLRDIAQMAGTSPELVAEIMLSNEIKRRVVLPSRRSKVRNFLGTISARNGDG